VSRHPVEDEPKTYSMQAIDEPAKVVGRSMSVGRRVIARRLVTPRALKGMLGHRQALNMGESER
jgi:hypothetical protein